MQVIPSEMIPFASVRYFESKVAVAFAVGVAVALAVGVDECAVDWR